MMDEFSLEQQATDVERAKTVNGLLTKVYLRMVGGLIVTGTAAWIAQHWVFQTFFVPLMISLWIVELGMVWYLSSRIWELKHKTATFLFYLYSAISGITLSVVLVAYPEASLAQAFACTAGMFAAMSIYGAKTKRNLSKWGRFLLMSLCGLIISLAVGIFLNSTRYDFIVSICGIVIFAGLTAYDTRKIIDESEYLEDGDIEKAATLGALELYLDFINLFLHILRVLKNR